jgi:hypothetical protein
MLGIYIALIYKKQNIVELTVPWEEEAADRKSRKYADPVKRYREQGRR